jgi:hypothetical protein
VTEKVRERAKNLSNQWRLNQSVQRLDPVINPGGFGQAPGVQPQLHKTKKPGTHTYSSV